jgi:hypothetical protein
MNHLRKVAAVLMMVSGVTHVVQVFVYGTEFSVVFAAVYGAMYFFIGVGLWGHSHTVLWLGAILPAIGGLLGIYRFFFLHNNPFSVFHVLIDLIVVPSCIYLLAQKPKIQT